MPTTIGVPEHIESYVEAVSSDVVNYLEAKCFGMLHIYAIPYSGVVDLVSGIITSKLEIIALTSPDMTLQSGLLKASATACLVHALSTIATIPNVDPDAPPTKVKKDICIPMVNILKVTNFSVPSQSPSASPNGDGSSSSSSSPPPSEGSNTIEC